MAEPQPGLHGVLVVDKPAGMTSHDVVARCRRVLGTRRVGHAGTLDPDATGVLLVGVGRCTRLLRFLGGLGKVYQGEVVLGVATTTLDASGEVTARFDMRDVSLTEVQAAAASLTGLIEQVPPMVSAVKVAGRRLHELARQGLEVPRPPRRVRVDRFTVAPTAEAGVFRIEVACSSGTYVRSLAADLGSSLGGGAHLRSLRRLAVGSFGVEEALALDEVGPARLLSAAQAARDLDRVVVDGALAERVRHGRPLDRVVVGARGEGPFGVLDPEGVLLAVYQAGDGDRLRPACVLEPAGEQVAAG
ncbi:tRNA pseudouridine(55) synthase TruB [Aciditerrimonas ferrireducens]|uniref:tRNA pseudouridine synthase B n=1 Tax=Aciditerrimonas ferrireducens TaxID=667306 RepID=A0ABV6C2D1_9ACTN